MDTETTTFSTSTLPYVTGLNLDDVTNLINDPIGYDVSWPTMPTKFPLDIPKFEGKVWKDPTNDVMFVHLWFSSNNIIENIVGLRLFQHTLIELVTKWYIE